MKDFINHLADQAVADRVRVDAALDDALRHLDHTLEGLAGALQVEHLGPFVGVEALGAHRLVVRAHAWRLNEWLWSLRVCSTAPQAGLRAEWTVAGASRMRKPLIVKALPEFFAGYARAVTAAGRAESGAGRRLLELAERFAVPAPD